MRRVDVRQDSGVWVLNFVSLPGRAGRNDIFQRMVPLHPAVIAEGFLDYHASLPTDPSGPLFADLTAAKDVLGPSRRPLRLAGGFEAWRASRELTRLLRTPGVTAWRTSCGR
ncbi:hypothetical protein ACFQX4_14360 [Roseomonas sp. GCM10028921]